MLSSVEHGKSFITSGPVACLNTFYFHQSMGNFNGNPSEVERPDVLGYGAEVAGLKRRTEKKTSQTD